MVDREGILISVDNYLLGGVSGAYTLHHFTSTLVEGEVSDASCTTLLLCAYLLSLFIPFSSVVVAWKHSLLT
jgi:hypothetical protein